MIEVGYKYTASGHLVGRHSRITIGSVWTVTHVKENMVSLESIANVHLATKATILLSRFGESFINREYHILWKSYQQDHHFFPKVSEEEPLIVN